MNLLKVFLRIPQICRHPKRRLVNLSEASRGHCGVELVGYSELKFIAVGLTFSIQNVPPVVLFESDFAGALRAGSYVAPGA